MKRPIKVCFVSPYNYPLFNPSITTKFGGFEVRIFQITRELARNPDFKVSVVVGDHGGPHREDWSGIETITWVGRKFSGIPEVIKPQNLASLATVGETHSDNQLSNDDEATETASDKPVRRRGWVEKMRESYEKRIPWKTRNVIHGFRVGFRLAEANLSNVTRQSIEAFTIPVKHNWEAARRAFSEINDQPIFFEEIAIFEEAAADVYVVPGNSHFSALAACYCKKRRLDFVMLAGSDLDFKPEIKDDLGGIDTYLTPHAWKMYAIQNADSIIVQNEKQERMASYFGVSPVLIRNPFDLERNFPKMESAQSILWVGNTNEQVKRPALLLEAARRLPQYSFTMILAPNLPEVFASYRQQTAEFPNLTLHSRMPFQEVERIFAQTKLFINTSSFEGLPNAFIQAGKYGVPIVALNVDPNGMLNRHGCGYSCDDDYELFLERIQQLMDDPVAYEHASEQILNYVRTYHDKAVILPQYEKIFKEIVN